MRQERKNYRGWLSGLVTLIIFLFIVYTMFGMLITHRGLSGLMDARDACIQACSGPVYSFGGNGSYAESYMCTCENPTSD